jgi:hypothetical protein
MTARTRNVFIAVTIALAIAAVLLGAMTIYFRGKATGRTTVQEAQELRERVHCQSAEIAVRELAQHVRDGARPDGVWTGWLGALLAFCVADQDHENLESEIRMAARGGDWQEVQTKLATALAALHDSNLARRPQ